jgi:DNA-binding GntR family transcriptional regulator
MAIRMRMRDDDTRNDRERETVSMKELFTEVKQESTRAKVYTALRDAIICGKLRTGQKLTEIELASSFNVSRSIIREALRELVRDGLVEQNAYRNTRVVRLTPQQVDEVLTVRLLLESEAVRLAHARLTPDDRRELKAIVAALEAARADQQRHAQLDLALHDRLWQLSGNATLEMLLRQITAPLFAMGVIVRLAAAKRPTRASATPPPADHRVLIEAICDDSVEAAVEAMRAHVTYNWQRIKEALAQFEEAESLADGDAPRVARPRARSRKS